MKPLPMRVMIATPQHIFDEVPATIWKTTLGELCREAGILKRVTGGTEPEIVCHLSPDHLIDEDTYYVSMVGLGEGDSRTQALRILEILAYGFCDYAARECVCGKGLFVGTQPKGRPPKSGQPKSAKERMVEMRARRRAHPA